MSRTSRFKTMRKLRRPVFWTWIAITTAVAGHVGLAAPFAAHVGAGKAWIAMVVPPSMILLLGIGSAWLFLYVAAPAPDRHEYRHDRRPLAH